MIVGVGIMEYLEQVNDLRKLGPEVLVWAHVSANAEIGTAEG